MDLRDFDINYIPWPWGVYSPVSKKMILGKVRIFL